MNFKTLSYIHGLIVRDITANEISVEKARENRERVAAMAEENPDNQNIQELYEEAVEDCNAWMELLSLSRASLDDFENQDWR